MGFVDIEITFELPLAENCRIGLEIFSEAPQFLLYPGTNIHRLLFISDRCTGRLQS